MRKKPGKPAPDGLIHGSATTYSRQKCRCEPCTVAAQAAYARKNENRNARKKRERAVSRVPGEPLIELLLKSENEVRFKYSHGFAAWVKHGVDVYTADRICVELETHPIIVYGQLWIDKALESIDFDEYART